MQPGATTGPLAVAPRDDSQYHALEQVQLCRHYWELYDAFAPRRDEARRRDPASPETAVYETFAFIHNTQFERLNEAADAANAVRTAEGRALLRAVHALYYSLGVARHFAARQIALAYDLWDWPGDQPLRPYGTLWRKGGVGWPVHEKLRALADGGDAIAERLWEAIGPTREPDGWFRDLNDIRNDLAHNATAFLGRLEPGGPRYLVNVHKPVWQRMRYVRPPEEGGTLLQPSDTYALPAVEQGEDLLRKVCAVADAVWAVLAQGIRERDRLPLV